MQKCSVLKMDGIEIPPLVDIRSSKSQEAVGD